MNKFSSIFCTVTYPLSQRTDFPELESLLDSKLSLQNVADKISRKILLLTFLYFSKPWDLLLLIQDTRRRQFHSLSIQ